MARNCKAVWHHVSCQDTAEMPHGRVGRCHDHRTRYHHLNEARSSIGCTSSSCPALRSHLLICVRNSIHSFYTTHHTGRDHDAIISHILRSSCDYDSSKALEKIDNNGMTHTIIRNAAYRPVSTFSPKTSLSVTSPPCTFNLFTGHFLSALISYPYRTQSEHRTVQSNTQIYLSSISP